MQLQGLQANVTTYSAAVSACEKDKQWARALELLREKCSHGLPADGITYSATVNAREKVKQWQCAWVLFEKVHLQ